MLGVVALLGRLDDLQHETVCAVVEPNHEAYTLPVRKRGQTADQPASQRRDHDRSPRNAPPCRTVSMRSTADISRRSVLNGRRLPRPALERATRPDAR